MEKIKDSILASLYDTNYTDKTEYAPRLVTNTPNETLWEELQQELLTCDRFVLAPAFISLEMLVPLKATLAKIADKNISGTIITSDYLNFNTPAVFYELLKLPNVDVLISDEAAFHMKGYFFFGQGLQTSYVGSANFTRQALLKGKELAIRLTNTKEGHFFGQSDQFLNELKKNSQKLTLAWITEYEKRYRPLETRSTKTTKVAAITPNAMQQVALMQLQKTRQENKHKGLIVSATGTGKTYLGAFDVKVYRPKRFLYIVHRKQILEKTISSFQKVLGGKASDYGIYSGKAKDKNAKYLFATVQTLAKEDELAKFSATEFDYILFDEAHHIGAKSYQKIMDHFEPDFCLGMTATPERMDDFNVYQAFDYELVYEISLKDALKEQMLCPFDYVGVSDYVLDGEVISEKTPLKQLIAPERVKHILKQLAYYGNKTSRGGLVFCSRQDEAKQLAKAFSQAGYKSQALTNENSVEERNKAVKKLEQGELKYLISVDILNEGVDIPCVDQIILLRNTESKIVFTQQLGRGLRKFQGKSQTLILDFIGNYQNNYLIPQVLNGTTTLNKDRLVSELNQQVVFELSTINFEKIAAKRILKTIEHTKLDALKRLKEVYSKVKKTRATIPTRMELLTLGDLDPRIFSQGSGLASYVDFLEKIGVDLALSSYEKQVISFLEKELLNGMRKHELLLLKTLLTKEDVSLAEYKKLLHKENCYFDQAVLASVRAILELSFFEVKVGSETRAKKYGGKALIEFKEETFKLSQAFKKTLANKTMLAHLEDILETGLYMSQSYDPDKRFTLYQKYTRKDVCRLLDLPKDISAPLYGYRVIDDVCPIFITYQKQKQSYQNTLTENKAIRWYTRSPRTLASNEVKALLQVDADNKPNVRLPLFIKPSDAFLAEFYYVGEALIDRKSVLEEELIQGGKVKKVVGMDLVFQAPLPLEILEKLQVAVLNHEG